MTRMRINRGKHSSSHLLRPARTVVAGLLLVLGSSTVASTGSDDTSTGSNALIVNSIVAGGAVDIQFVGLSQCFNRYVGTTVGPDLIKIDYTDYFEGVCLFPSPPRSVHITRLDVPEGFAFADEVVVQIRNWDVDGVVSVVAEQTYENPLVAATSSQYALLRGATGDHFNIHTFDVNQRQYVSRSFAYCYQGGDAQPFVSDPAAFRIYSHLNCPDADLRGNAQILVFDVSVRAFALPIAVPFLVEKLVADGTGRLLILAEDGSVYRTDPRVFPSAFEPLGTPAIAAMGAPNGDGSVFLGTTDHRVLEWVSATDEIIEHAALDAPIVSMHAPQGRDWMVIVTRPTTSAIGIHRLFADGAQDQKDLSWARLEFEFDSVLLEEEGALYLNDGERIQVYPDVADFPEDTYTYNGAPGLNWTQDAVIALSSTSIQIAGSTVARVGDSIPDAGAFVTGMLNGGAGISEGLSGRWRTVGTAYPDIHLSFDEADGVTATWLSFDGDGFPLWLMGSGAWDSEKVRVRVSRYEAGIFPPPFSQSVPVAWGKLVFRFFSSTEGAMRWVPNDGSETGWLRIERFSN